MRIQIAQLGLAAYIKMQGATLIEVKNRVFHFETDKTANQWRTEYSNSCCMRHDALVCELRHHIRQV